MSRVVHDPLFTYPASKEAPDQYQRHPPFQEIILLVVTILLLSFSLVMVYSTTGVVSQEKFGDAFYYVKRQGIAAVVGMFALYGFSKVPVEFLKKISPYLFFVALGLLAGTYVPGLGDRAGGAQRWLNLRIVRFQPGEFVKLLFIVYLAGFLARHEDKLKEFVTGIVKPFCLVGVLCALFLKQPDFGSSAILCLITVAMTGGSGARLRHLGMMLLSFAIPAALLVAFSPYRMKRITSFLSPWADPSGSGYQLIQSLIAVGSGKITGLGLGGSQQKLFFLPAAHTDFIFAVIAEELGMVGCLCLLMAFLIFLARGLKLAGKVVDDTFTFSLSIGLTLLIVLPAMLNTGVVTGILPTKGMVLPLVGYGGSSILSCLIAVGMLFSISRWNQLRR